MNKSMSELGYRQDLLLGKIHRGNFDVNKAFLLQQMSILRGAKVLELGCGAGQLTHWLVEQGIDCVGADFSAELLSYASEFLPGRFQRLDAQQLAYASQSFDVVLSFDVLEHLPDVHAHLLEVKRVLRPEGYYLLQTPNKLTNVPYEIWHHRSLTHYKTFHCSLQTARSLWNILHRFGFKPTFIKMDVRTPFFKQKLQKAFGLFAWPLQRIPYHKMPTSLTTNFYVVAKQHT